MAHIINVFIYKFCGSKILLNPEANNSVMPATFSVQFFLWFIILIRV